MYAKGDDSATMSKAKGIEKCAIKNREIKHEHFVNTLNGNAPGSYPNTTIKSTRHNLETIVTYKKSLDANDDKRVFYSREQSFTPGHYKLYFT